MRFTILLSALVVASSAGTAFAQVKDCVDALVVATFQSNSERLKDHRLAEVVTESSYNQAKSKAGASATIYGIPMGANWSDFQKNVSAYSRRYENDLSESEIQNVLWTGLTPETTIAYRDCLETVAKLNRPAGVSLFVERATDTDISLLVSYRAEGPIPKKTTLQWEHSFADDVNFPTEMMDGSRTIIIPRPVSEMSIGVNSPESSTTDSAMITPLPEVLSSLDSAGRIAVFKVPPGTLPPLCNSAGGPAPQRVPTHDNRGRVNLALLATSSSYTSSVVPGHPNRHESGYVSDGWYNNCRSWIPETMPSFAQIDLGDEYLISAIALGSEFQSHFRDRAASKFSIASSSTPNGPWVTLVDGSDGSRIVRGRTQFEFNPTIAQYIRVNMDESIGGQVRVDELEIYGHY
ncbi:MAG: discoidin domain-containing protein [Pseudomonadota bacterium]